MKFLAEMLWRDLYIRSLENSRRMLDHIYPYLLVHKKLQLAGIGTLEMVPVSAAIDKGGLRISAPYEKINFIPTLRNVKERFDKDLIMCTYNSTKKTKEYVSYR